MGTLAANLAAVLLAALLLGAAVWVVGIALLAWLTTRPAVTVGVLVTTGAALGATALAYVAAVVLMRLVLPA